MTDYIARHSLDKYLFIPHLFQGFPEVKESLISNRMQAGFLVAPLAIALRSQGVPIKIVFLGHRYGSATVVKKNGPVKTVADLKGKTIAIPSRFSDELFLLRQALKKNGLEKADVRTVEMAPPDMVGALAANAIDGFVVGEPFPSQAEMSGHGRVLFHAREYWPDYLSCVLVVREEIIRERPEAVQVLVDGIARSGLWLDEGQPEREYAAEFVGRYYYNQPPAMLKWALTRPLDRVQFNPLGPSKADFEMIHDMMLEEQLIDRPMAFEEYVEPRFAEEAVSQTKWDFPVGHGRLDPSSTLDD